ncbi:uncharacterized protein LOC127129428 [Lathyrus oleraceus]|uniref:uncharacterized protein LOC127129428 n=1 Tax=Pisum sativum TaxID=3888 RepID=UPI0021D2D57E|nr:uncharacterized protein LOC127129428 [Pisum sativum]
MACTEAQKVQFGKHILTEEVDDRWGNTRQRLEAAGNEITWVVFKGEFLDKFFPEDVRGKKEIEFLELKQGNSTVAEYAAKFEELMKLCSHYNDAVVVVSKCIKLENGLRSKIKQGISYQQTRRFPKLVNKCIIYDEDADKRKQGISYDRRPSVGDDPAHIKCYSTTCQKPKKSQTGGKVFVLAGSQPNSSIRLIRGTCYIHDISLIAIIDTGATRSFISANCVRKVGRVLSTLNGGLVIDTSTNGSVTTCLVCLNYPLSIYGKDFGINLIFLPLEDMDVIMGMKWLEFNHVYVNYYNKTLRFLASEDKQEDDFISAKELKELLKDEATT